jgi:hypothetical protein
MIEGEDRDREVGQDIEREKDRDREQQGGRKGLDARR